jgi:hypothetical protein
MSRSRIAASLRTPLGVLVVFALLTTAVPACDSPAAVFGVTALAIAPGQDEIVTGDEVLVTAQVQNTGALTGTYDAALSVDGVVRSQSEADLAPGQVTTLSFRIEAGLPGDYEVRLGGQRLSLHVSAPAAAVFSVTALAVAPGQDEIATGDEVVVTAQVQNIGTLAGTFDAALSVDGAVQPQNPVEMVAGETRTVQFRIDAGPPGQYELRLGDARATLTVPAPAAFEVSALALTPNPSQRGGHLSAAVSVTNSGGLTGTFDAKVTIDGKVAATTKVTVPAGELTTVELPLKMPAAGRHTVAAGGVEVKLVVWDITRPANGKILVNKVSGGRGQLTIKNGDDRDAVVVLAKSSSPKKALLAVYLRGHKSKTIKGIKDGKYVVYFSLGKAWDAHSKAFTNSQELRRFQDTMRFKTTRSAYMITYSIWTVSLHQVAGGNAPTTGVGDGDFPNVP